MSTLSFKQLLQEDITNVFFNNEEFTDEHIIVIDGETLRISVSIDQNELLERQNKEYVEGVHTKQLIIYVKAAEFGKMPKIGSKFKLDGKEYLVIECLDEVGVYSITIEATKG